MFNKISKAITLALNLPQDYKQDKLEETLRKKYQKNVQQLTFNPNTRETLASLDIALQQIRDCQSRNVYSGGFPLVSTDAVIANYESKVQELIDASGLSPENQQRFLMRAVRNLANCVHLIPASASWHHRELGGIFLHSLECAIFAAREISFRRLPTDDDDGSHIDKTKWTLACILCALFHDVGKIVTDVQIQSRTRKIFYPYKSPLNKWLAELDEDRYFVTWIGRGKFHERALAGMLIRQSLIPPETFRWLGNRISKEVEAFINNIDDSTFSVIVKEADCKSTADNREIGHISYDTSFDSKQDIDNFFEAIKKLIYAGKHPSNVMKGWSINNADSELIYCDKGHLFIIWDSLKQIRELYDSDGIHSTFFNPIKRTDELSNSELENELLSMVNRLKQEGYLELNGYNNTPESNHSSVWDIRRVNQETLVPDDNSIRAICLNAVGVTALFPLPSTRPTPNKNLINFSDNSQDIITDPIPISSESSESQDDSVGNSAISMYIPPMSFDDPNEKELIQPQSPEGIKRSAGLDKPKLDPRKDKEKYMPYSPKKETPKQPVAKAVAAKQKSRRTFFDNRGNMTKQEFLQAIKWEFMNRSGKVKIKSDANGAYIENFVLQGLCRMTGCQLTEINTAVLQKEIPTLSLDTKNLRIYYLPKQTNKSP